MLISIPYTPATVNMDTSAIAWVPHILECVVVQCLPNPTTLNYLEIEEYIAEYLEDLSNNPNIPTLTDDQGIFDYTFITGCAFFAFEVYKHFKSYIRPTILGNLNCRLIEVCKGYVVLDVTVNPQT